MLSKRRTLSSALLALALSATALTGSVSAYVGGHDALQDKPFVAGIRVAGTTNFFCTGTLIGASWVLTAKHCLDEGRTAGELEVVVGATQRTVTTAPVERHSSDRIELHPGWHDTKDRNDVALIHLAIPSAIVPVRLGVTPAFADGVKRCVQLTNLASAGMARMMVEQTCVSGRGKALGWGRVSMDAPGTSATLREVTPKIFGPSRNTYWRVKAGACPGDSGGPLLVLGEDGTPRQIGIASYADNGGGYFDWLEGDACSTKGRDYYSDASAGSVRDWIESVTMIRDHRS